MTVRPLRTSATDVQISYETSNLTTWTPLAVEPVSAGITDFETEQVAVGVPTIKLQFFLRMRFTKP